MSDLRPSRTSAVAASTLVALVGGALVSSFFRHPGALGAHDWDQMESHRLFVVKALREFGRFPFWDPYGCGGAPAWGAPESGTIAASPLLAAYLTLPLGVALRLEIVASVAALVLGMRFFAARYLRHPLAIAFACVVGALNSRAALQIAVGHTWHLAYAGMPWVLGAFDRATSGDRPRRWLALGAVVLAWMVYAGGVYPVPHTALALLGVAAFRARATRDRGPLVIAVTLGACAVLLAAPKLLPVLDTMARFPRLAQSRETVPPADWLRMFTASAADVGDHRTLGLDYMWHEYGQYVGLVPLAVVLWGSLRRIADPELRSLRFAGWSFMALALGGWGPWVLLHRLPPFASLRAPTRFTYPGLMLLAVVAAAEAERRLAAWKARPMAVALWGAFAGSAVLVAREDARATAPWFALEAPQVPRAPRFVQYAEVPPAYAYGDGDPESPGGVNGPPGLLLRRAGVGSLRCMGFPGLNVEAPRSPDGRPLGMGARGLGDPRYRGEAWVEPAGTADVVAWAPGEVVLSVQDAPPGARVVLDQNWDPSWTANGSATRNLDGVNMHPLAASRETVVFRYRPRTLPAGLALFACGVLFVGRSWRSREDADRLGPRTPREDAA
jgi:hypothetical protein